jgi:hypothetical protein
MTRSPCVQDVMSLSRTRQRLDPGRFRDPMLTGDT